MPNHVQERGGGKRGDTVKRAGSRLLESRLSVLAIGFDAVFTDVARISVTSLLVAGTAGYQRLRRALVT
jgi:hypothetical protein